MPPMQQECCPLPGLPFLGQRESKAERAPEMVLALIDANDADLVRRIRLFVPEIEFLPLPANCLESLGRACMATSNGPSAPAKLRLTQRQKDVLDCVRQGMSNKEIGRKLGISHFTVRNHVSRLFQMLGSQSRHNLGTWDMKETRYGD